MSSGSTLLKRFVDDELNGYIRAILENAFAERRRSENVLVRAFEFNCFDVTLDFENNVVTLEDVLFAGDGSAVDMPMCDFVVMCNLNVAC